MKRYFLVLLALLATISVPALADGPTIRITGTGAKASDPIPVSLAGIRPDGSQEAALFLKVLHADLDRSGWLKVANGQITQLRVDGIVRGGGSLAADLRIIGETMTPWARNAAADDVRTAAHNAADEILLRLTGHKGMASAPILLVGKRGGRTDVYCCDSDGARLRTVTSDGTICQSPSWLPNRSGFLYTGFLKRYGAIYRVDFLPGNKIRRTPVANFPGLNNCGVVSPDSRLAAMVLSFTGNVELYVMNLQTKRLTRLTRTLHANEASPSWSPDGRSIIYVSDEEGGRPQVFRINMGERSGRRLVHSLRESVAPDWSPNGDKIAFCGKAGGTYGIYVCTLDGRFVLVSPNDGCNYEDPSWAPDGRHIVASRSGGGGRTLVLLDAEGDSQVNLTPYAGDWYLPDWAR